MFKNYNEAKAAAKKSKSTLWDTKSLPERYGVGEPTVEMEEDPNNSEWEIVEVKK